VYHGPQRKDALAKLEGSKHGTVIVISTEQTILADLNRLWVGVSRTVHGGITEEQVNQVIGHIAPIHARQWGVVVVDEAHRLRSVFTRAYQSVACL